LAVGTAYPTRLDRHYPGYLVRGTTPQTIAGEDEN
jgi:hypothetical protein